MTACERGVKHPEKAQREVLLANMPAEVSMALSGKGLRRAWPGLSHEQRQRAIAALAQRMVVHPAGNRGRVFNPDRIDIVPR
jgi:hypothetical protein